MGQPAHGDRGRQLPGRAGGDGGREQRVRGHRRALGHRVARDDRHPRSRRDRGTGRLGARASAGVRIAPGVAYDPRGARAAFRGPPRLPVRAAGPARGGGRGGAAAASRGPAMTRWLGLGLAVALAFALAVLLGPAHVPLAQLASSDIVRSLRLPRAVLALLVGGALGLAGASLQALVRNPLADPFLLGLSGGAGLGAVLAIALHVTGPWALPLAAFVGALAAMALVYRLGLVGARSSTRASSSSQASRWAPSPPPSRPPSCRCPRRPSCETPSSGCGAGSRARPGTRCSWCASTSRSPSPCCSRRRGPWTSSPWVRSPRATWAPTWSPSSDASTSRRRCSPRRRWRCPA